jgi:hypothetical protein
VPPHSTVAVIRSNITVNLLDEGADDGGGQGVAKHESHDPTPQLPQGQSVPEELLMLDQSSDVPHKHQAIVALGAATT